MRPTKQRAAYFIYAPDGNQRTMVGWVFDMVAGVPDVPKADGVS